MRKNNIWLALLGSIAGILIGVFVFSKVSERKKNQEVETP
jgi:hypothetical protein